MGARGVGVCVVLGCGGVGVCVVWGCGGVRVRVVWGRGGVGVHSSVVEHLPRKQYVVGSNST